MRCSTLGRDDFMRVPCPAARTMTASEGSATVSDMLRRQDSNLDLTAPKAVVLPLHHGGPAEPCGTTPSSLPWRAGRSVRALPHLRTVTVRVLLDVTPAAL